MVAAIVSNKTAIEKLVKNGCDLYTCPLVFCKQEVRETVETTKYNKIMISKEIGLRERRQYDALEILRMTQKYDLIGEIMYWQEMAKAKQFRKDKNMSDCLESFPNCSFQIDWK
jgi:hypothetical protein